MSLFLRQYKTIWDLRADPPQSLGPVKRGKPAYLYCVLGGNYLKFGASGMPHERLAYQFGIGRWIEQIWIAGPLANWREIEIGLSRAMHARGCKPYYDKQREQFKRKPDAEQALHDCFAKMFTPDSIYKLGVAPQEQPKKRKAKK